MLCQKCNHNNATIHFEQNINGKITEMDLCPECAKEMNIGMDMNLLSGADSLFNNFWGDPGSFFTLPLSHIAKQSCPSCHTSLSSLINSSFLGCTDCYDEFGDMIEQNLKNYQRGTRHTGKRPRSLGAAPQQPVKEQAPLSEADKLRAELKQAVKEENYERAAELRDKIKELGEK